MVQNFLKYFIKHLKSIKIVQLEMKKCTKKCTMRSIFRAVVGGNARKENFVQNAPDNRIKLNQKTEQKITYIVTFYFYCTMSKILIYLFIFRACMSLLTY